MTIVTLTGRARERMERVIRTGQRGREVRRAQALIWLSQGVSVSEVARRTRLTRQAVYELVRRYEQRRDRPVAERICDGTRSGRPATGDQDEARVAGIGPLVAGVAESVGQYGYRAACWTVPMLRVQIERQAKMNASDDLIRRALRR